MKTDDLITQILIKRGLDTKEAREEFLSDRPTLVHDPFLLSDMKEAIDLMHEAIETEAQICIYGDYDCDGVAASVLLYQFFKHIASLMKSESRIITYIPNRIEEGYGLNENAICKLSENSVDLIITVDCGSVSAKEVAIANELGMEILITDHHDMDEANIPDCLLVNPKNKKASYPFMGLSGCAVAYKLIQAYQRTYGDEDMRHFVNSMLDLVAISLVADVCPAVDENRTLLKYGLNMLKNGSRRSISSLLKAVSFDETKITERQLGFIIGPHINAAGRVSSPSLAFSFLMETDEEKLNIAVKKLIECNNTRKQLQNTCVEYCKRIYEEEQADKPIIIINSKTAHEGIIGIVAGRIKEEMHKPCIILTENSDNYTLKASCRSQGKLDITKLLRGHAELFVKLGGHAMAAGFTIEAKNFDELVKLLTSDVEYQLKETPDLFLEDETVDIDMDDQDLDLSLDLVENVQQLAPFGTQNLTPRVQVSGVVRQASFMGANREHVRFLLGEKPCIYFRDAGKYKKVFDSSASIKIVGTLAIDDFKKQPVAQIIVERLVI